MFFEEYTKNYKKVERIKIDQIQHWQHAYNLYEEMATNTSAHVLNDDCILVNQHKIESKNVHIDPNDIFTAKIFSGKLIYKDQEMILNKKKEINIQFADEKYKYCMNKVFHTEKIDLTQLKQTIGEIKLCIAGKAIDIDEERDNENFSKNNSESINDKLKKLSPTKLSKETDSVENNSIDKITPMKQFVCLKYVQNAQNSIKTHYKHMFYTPKQKMLENTKFMLEKIEGVKNNTINSFVLACILKQCMFIYSQDEIIALYEICIKEFKNLYEILYDKILKTTATTNAYTLLKVIKQFLSQFDIKTKNIQEETNALLSTYAKSSHSEFWLHLIYFMRLKISTDYKNYITFFKNISIKKYNAPWYYEILRFIENDLNKRLSTTKTPQEQSEIRKIAHAYNDLMDNMPILTVAHNKLSKYFYKNLKLIVKSNMFTIKNVEEIFDCAENLVLVQYPESNKIFIADLEQAMINLELKIFLTYFEEFDTKKEVLNSKQLHILDKLYVAHLQANKIYKVENNQLEEFLNQISKTHILDTNVSEELKSRVNK